MFNMIEKVYFDYIEELAEGIVDVIESDDSITIAVIGKYPEIRSLLKSLMIYENTTFSNVELWSKEFNGYDKEFTIGIWTDKNGDINVGCEPSEDEDEYLFHESDVIYIFENCSLKILYQCEADKIYSVCIDKNN